MPGGTPFIFRILGIPSSQAAFSCNNFLAMLLVFQGYAASDRYPYMILLVLASVG